MKQLKDLTKVFALVIKTGRYKTSFISGFLSFLVIYVHSESTFLIACVRGIPIMFITMIGFILNDIYDYQKDKLANKNRPICNDELNKGQALLAGGILLLLAISIDILFLDFKALSIIILTFLFVGLYSPFSKKLPLFKGLFTAILCCAPLVYGLSIANSEINIVLFVSIILFIVGREIMLDIFDSQSDYEYKLKTIPIYIGEFFSYSLSWILMFLGCILLFMFSFSNNVSLLCSIVTLVSVSMAFYYLKKHKRLFFESYTRIALLTGSIAITFLR